MEMNVNSVCNLMPQLHIYQYFWSWFWCSLWLFSVFSVRKYSDRRKYNCQWKSPIWRTDFEILPMKIDEKKLFWGWVRKEYMSCTQIIKFLFFVYLFTCFEEKTQKEASRLQNREIFIQMKWMNERYWNVSF